MNSIESFRDALRVAGLDYGGDLIPDGKLHRFKAADDREKNSWYVLHAGVPVAGAFGCLKRGIKETWCERNGQLLQVEWNEVHRRWHQAERERERTEKGRHEKARKVAAWILDRAKLVTAHAYLKAKGVKVFGDMREYRGALVLPLRDTNGELHSLQFIGADGVKRFLGGGRIAGCLFALADKPESPLAICEGYATGASIFEATGFAVVCALNCGNLLAVSKSLREKFSSREIIIAADNDQFTDGNPGVTKADEAAKAIHAKVAVPQFVDASTRPTDFNDMAAFAGLAEVKLQIETATAPKESDDEILQRLAMLPLLEYERCRDAQAGRLGIKRVSILDKLVDTKRPKSELQNDELQGRTVNLADVELWPDVVNGADVLSEIAETFARYVALPDDAGDALALWTAHAHCFESFVCSPRLNISSPEKGCGKTTLRDVLAVLVPRPLATENLTVAVLFRLIHMQHPTVLADECDAWLRDNEELRGIMNAGHRRGGVVPRCVGDNHEVRAFNVFAPVVLCGIGALPGTIHDRSIIIQLERAKSGELRERFDSRRVERETELCRKLARFCADNKARIEASEPALPSGAFNRLGDNWRPLFAVAEIAGGDWPQRAADAFTKLTGKEDSDAQGVGVVLLADVRGVFSETGGDRIWTEVLCGHLNGMQERPYADMRSGQGINAHRLGKLLGRFKISSRKIRLPGEPKPKQGYCLEDFQEVFDRYLPPTGDSKRNIGTSIENIDYSTVSKVEQPETVFHFQKTEKTNDGKGCSSVLHPMGAGAEISENEPLELLI